MTDSVSEQGDELTQVLSRISQLMGQAVLPIQEDKEEQQVDIPLLTEIYKPAPAFTEDDFAKVDVLNKVIAANETVSQRVQTKVIDQLVAGMRPLIQKVIKKAVLEESVKAEKLLVVKLEQELVQALNQRLNAHVHKDQ